MGGKVAGSGVVQFETGAVRSSDRVGQRYDLISPIGLRRLAETCDEGARKYSDYNWERGMPISEMLNHAIAHLYAYLSGDRSEDHLAHAAWNCFGAMHSEELWPELNTTLRQEGCKPPPMATAKPAADWNRNMDALGEHLASMLYSNTQEWLKNPANQEIVHGDGQPYVGLKAKAADATPSASTAESTAP